MSDSQIISMINNQISQISDKLDHLNDNIRVEFNLINEKIDKKVSKDFCETMRKAETWGLKKISIIVGIIVGIGSIFIGLIKLLSLIK